MIEQFYEKLLKLDEKWKVKSVEQDNNNQVVTVNITAVMGTYHCPECGLLSPLHDYRDRKVRHLDSCEYQTYLSVKYPRIDCVQCGTKAIAPPFAADNSRFTKAFENRIIELCNSVPAKKVARDMKLHWNVVYGIKNRAYKRAIEKQQLMPKIKIYNLAIDEVSFKKYHDYVTVISDKNTGHVLAVHPGRDAKALTTWFTSQKNYDFTELKSISMDMAPPYIKAIREVFPENHEELICFDRFHVSQMFIKAVDIIRRRESAQLDRFRQYNPLGGTRFEWMRNSVRTDNRQGNRRKFLEITKNDLDTSKAWRLKELASVMWDYAAEGTAKKAWNKLLWLLSHSRISELKKLFKSIKEHLYGIINAIRLRSNNALAEARNSCIQRVKFSSCGYRNRERFCQEIMFQFGGLNLAF